jgi:hypothetical protein
MGHRPSARVSWLAPVLVLVAACGGPATSPPRVLGERVTPAQRERPCAQYTLIGAVRGHEATARERARRDARVVGRFASVNDQGAGQVFPLLDETYAGGRVWYQALLPVRPNGTMGWIPENVLRLERSDYRLRVDLERFRLEVFRLCERVATYRIGVGTHDTPTPRGTFFLNSLLRPPGRGTVYGAFAFGLSGYSEVIHDWTWGGVVGLHGTDDPSSIGHAVSHGCIRLRNQDIRTLAKTLPLGTLVEIV